MLLADAYPWTTLALLVIVFPICVIGLGWWAIGDYVRHPKEQ